MGTKFEVFGNEYRENLIFNDSVTLGPQKIEILFKNNFKAPQNYVLTCNVTISALFMVSVPKLSFSLRIKWLQNVNN
jgi:hypothetical protein